MKDTDKCFETTLDRRLLNEDIDIVESSDNSPEVNETNIEFE
jgi:hypothetical protein